MQEEVVNVRMSLTAKLFMCFMFLVPACQNGCSKGVIVKVLNQDLLDPGVLLDYNVALVDEKQRPYCAGTLVEYDPVDHVVKVVTALHCVDDEKDDPKEYVFIKVAKHIYKAEVLKIQRESDLALLQTTDKVNGEIPVAQVGKFTPSPGHPIWIVGSGAGIEDILSHGTMSVPHAISRWSNVHVDIIDGSAFYGNSGGGVYNDKFELIGVLIEVGPQGPQGTGLWAHSVNLDEIIALLQIDKVISINPYAFPRIR